MNLNDIDVLLKNSEGPCITITLPTDRINARKNHESLKKAIQKAKNLLKTKLYSEEQTNDLIVALDSCTARLPETLYDGVGIYISPKVFTILTFPFEVEHKVTADDDFELRDALCLRQYGLPYYVLSISKKGVQLFEGTLNELREIKDGNFPLFYKDQFEYQRASVANSSSGSLKGFEKEKKEISEIRLKTVFREADAHLKSLLAPDKKVLLAGTQKMVSLFSSITSLRKEIAGRIFGSYNESNLGKLSHFAWSAMTSARKKEIGKQVKDLHEKNGRLAEGILPAWNAAGEGKGLLLLVEKDLHHRAYQKEEETSIHLQPPKKPYTVIPDAVNDLINTVQSRNGKVVFTENDQLKDFDHVALVLRY